MLPSFVIEEIRRREEAERLRRSEEQPSLELPLPQPSIKAPVEDEYEKRGVIIIDL